MRIPFAIAFSFLSITALGQIATPLPRPAVSFGAKPEVINEPYSADAVTTTVADASRRHSHQQANHDCEDVPRLGRQDAIG